MRQLDEEGFKDKVKRWDATIASSLGSSTGKGKKQLLTVKKALGDDFKTFLAKANRMPNTGALIDFLIKKVNFSATNVKHFLADANIPFDRQDMTIVQQDALDKIFENGAAFALENDLVGQYKDKPSSGDVVSKSSKGKRSGATGVDVSDELDRLVKAAQGKSFTGKDTKSNDSVVSFDQKSYQNILKQSGLSGEYFEDLVDIAANEKSFADIEKRPDAKELTKQLAKLGFAMFKSMDKK